MGLDGSLEASITRTVSQEGPASTKGGSALFRSSHRLLSKLKGNTVKRALLGSCGAGRLIPGLALLFLAVGCRGEATGPKHPTELEFADVTGVELALMTETGTGLYFQDLVVGTGTRAQPGDTVTVHYTGWLHDGTLFDSSVSRDQPFVFILGIGMVIPGWDEGVDGMRAGGKRKLVIPPHLGYGSSRNGSIPGNSTLVFDVELLAVNGEEEPPS